MYLKSLEIAGFKSFAKKADLGFSTPITSIVGPNGSGKSNVAEAFRFVLGEQSIKSMRGKKGEDLIFNGGKSLSKLNRASVKVVFDNSRRILNLDFDEVSLERVVHRDGINEYFVNGSQVRLRDILELLAQAHVGSSGHHIISQGEADKILNANLGERREMVEDALGLKIYHYKREESLRKLDKTEENLKSVQSLRREIAPHIKFLEKQVEKVEKARQMKQDLELLYKEYLKREDTYIRHQKELIGTERKEPQDKLEALETELRHARSVLEKSTTKDKKSSELLILEAKLKENRLAKDELVREIGRIEGSITSFERTMKKQQELLASEEHRTVAIKEIEDLEQSVSKKLDEIGNSSDITLIKQTLAFVRDLFRNFVSTHRTETKSAVLDDAASEIVLLSGEKRTVEEKMKKADIEILECQAAYSALQSEIEKEKDTNRDAEKAVFRIMAEENEVRSKLNDIKNREERITFFEQEFKRELQEGAVLIGREVLQFGNFNITDKSGRSLGIEEVAAEERMVQEDRRKTIEKMKIRIEDSGVGASDEIVKEYKETTERDEFLRREIEDLEKTALSLKGLIAELEQKLDTEFKQGVIKINSEFGKFFALMFGGGEASLKVVREEKRRKKSDIDKLMALGEGLPSEASESDEEAKEGIDISVSLPHKKTKGLMMLSGGERALTSIALLFAISQVNPPPFIILDETDAALDEANSRKYGDMIENLSKYSQLILITHNRETMSRAGVLYGVTMSADGFSKLLSIKFDEAVQVAK